ncbi:MAG: hypothetical protein R3222_09735 [Balneolaceae bacterium]|nr:hypothetical protein [Balneolaceae bacterium]
MNYLVCIFLSFLIWILPFRVKAQFEDDHLEPVDQYFSLSDSDLEYFRNMKEILFEGLSQNPEIRILVLPSFHPEYVLDIMEEKESERRVVYLNVAKDYIYHVETQEELERIELMKFRKQIEEDSFDLIYKLFQTVIYQVRYNKPERFLVRADGTNYYFSVFDDGLKSGTIWSPSKGSKMGRLIDISERIFKLATENNSFLKVDGELETKIETLIDDLNEHPSEREN